jgi:hypothetical protein
MKACTRLFYIFRPIWIIMVVAGLHATADRACAQHEIFDESVIQKWKDYEAFSHELQGTARVQRISNGKPQESTFRFKQNRGCALVIGPHNRDPLLLLCLLGNPRYLAKIDLSKSDLGNAVLHSYTPLPGDMGGLSPFEFVFMETSRHFSYGVQTLRQTVSDPSFKVTKVAKEIQNGQELIRVDHVYNYVRHVANDDIHERRHGSLWLDPSRCWCIRQSKVSTETTIRGERISDTEADVVCETIDHPSGFPILKSVTEQVKIFPYKTKRRTEGSSQKDYELEVNDNVPDSAFTLTAFGLPEPGSEPVKKSIPLFVWILVAAGICAALALGFRYLARRRVRSPSAA